MKERYNGGFFMNRIKGWETVFGLNFLPKNCIIDLKRVSYFFEVLHFSVFFVTVIFSFYIFLFIQLNRKKDEIFCSSIKKL
jgi:hypothetical protein